MPASARQPAFLALAAFLLLAGAPPATAHSGDHYYAPRGSAVIDGDLSDWPDIWQPIAEMTSWPGTYHGPWDFNAHFAVQWEGDVLYLAAEVDDDVHACDQVEGSIWIGDSVQWRLDLDHASSGTVREVEWGYARSTRDGQLYTPVWSSTSPSFVDHRVVRDEESGVTRYEAAVRLPTALRSATVLGLAVLVNDGDGTPGVSLQSTIEGREAVLEWASGVFLASKDRLAHGDLHLVERFPETGILEGRIGIVPGDVAVEHSVYPDLEVVAVGVDGSRSKGRTDHFGRYRLALPAGEYVLHAGRGQGVAAFERRPVNVATGRTSRIDMTVRPEPLLARVAFRVPPDHHEDFASFYRDELAPQLDRLGAISVHDDGRATPDSVVTRLLAVEDYGLVSLISDALAGDSMWTGSLARAAARLALAEPDTSLPFELSVYAGPAGTGRVIT